MWSVKKFKTNDQQERWIEANEGRYQITRLFINNGYAVEYKRLRVIG